MEFHYTDVCVPSDHLLTDPYVQDFTPQYMLPNHEAEYEVRNSILVDGGDRFGVSAVVFDKFEELVWMGNQGGHVTSYYGPAMQKYTSFQVHATEEVRDIITVEQGIYVLTKSMLRHQIRRGIPKHTHRSENMSDMQCLYQVNSNKLLMGGHQNKLIDLDLNKMVETVIPVGSEGCAVLRGGGGGGPVVAAGSANGRVALRDLRAPAAPTVAFAAHSACLSDLDMQGDLLITCGFTQSPSGQAVAESYVVVWDVRCLRGKAGVTEPAWTIASASPPQLLHFLPAFSGRTAAASGNGHVALLNVNAREEEGPSVFQVSTQNSVCTVMDVASTSQALVFGDQSGHLHLFSPRHNQEPVFNNFSRATQFADSPPELPAGAGAGAGAAFQFASVALPPLAAAAGPRWFNELPPEFYKRVYRKPKPVDPEVLKSMKMQGPIGHAPNPKTFRRNEMPYVEDTLEDLLTAKQNDSKSNPPPVPKHYQKMDLRYSKHSSNDIDLEGLNKTGFPGLESSIPNSYCNSMLQVLYYTPLVKSVLLAHTCSKEFCLSCELGFLFKTLDASRRPPGSSAGGAAACQAARFLRAFRTVPEAAALGLILPERGPEARVDLVALIQSWNRFILHQIHSELLETRKKEKVLTMNSPPKRNGTAKSGLATPQMNGQHSDEFQYTELEFLGPTTDFDSPEATDFRTQDIKENGMQIPNHVDGEIDGSSEPELPEDSAISRLFAIGRHQVNRCLKCNKEEERESAVLACALQYPSGPAGAPGSANGAGTSAGAGAGAGGFAEVLRASLSSRRATPAWCEHCARFTPTTQRGRLARLPPILAINCGGVSAHEKAYWAKGTQRELAEPRRGKPCRYGLQCARPGCRFRHPDRPCGAGGAGGGGPCCVPLQLAIRLQADGDLLIADKSDQSPADSPINKPDKKKKAPIQSEEEYALSAAVVCVEDVAKHLVAYVHIADAGDDPQWYMFNDVSIVPVSADEVSQFGAWWKSPCVLFYTSRSAAPPAPPAPARS